MRVLAHTLCAESPLSAGGGPRHSTDSLTRIDQAGFSFLASLSLFWLFPRSGAAQLRAARPRIPTWTARAILAWRLFAVQAVAVGFRRVPWQF